MFISKKNFQSFEWHPHLQCKKDHHREYLKSIDQNANPEQSTTPLRVYYKIH